MKKSLLCILLVVILALLPACTNSYDYYLYRYHAQDAEYEYEIGDMIPLYNSEEYVELYLKVTNAEIVKDNYNKGEKTGSIVQINYCFINYYEDEVDDSRIYGEQFSAYSSSGKKLPFIDYNDGYYTKYSSFKIFVENPEEYCVLKLVDESNNSTICTIRLYYGVGEVEHDKILTQALIVLLSSILLGIALLIVCIIVATKRKKKLIAELENAEKAYRELCQPTICAPVAEFVEEVEQ